jgi:hypothetical protein
MPPPFVLAANVYEQEPCANTFEHDLFQHLLYGCVISTPGLFAMVRPVRLHWPIETLRDITAVAEDGDVWWIYLAAGDVAQLFDLLPVKKWVAFERENRPRLYEYNRLRRLLLIPRKVG